MQRVACLLGNQRRSQAGHLLLFGGRTCDFFHPRRRGGLCVGGKSLLVALAIAAFQSLPAAAWTPTNHTTAFRRFDLYSGRVQAIGVTDHLNLSSYPQSLENENLLVVRSPGDTVGFFRSEPYDAINLLVHGGNPTSLVEYAVTPPQYASSIGLLSMAFNVFSGTGEFSDLGKRILTVRGTYEDGDTLMRGIHVGSHIRDWLGGTVNCAGTRTYYTAPPSDPFAGVIHSDAVNGYYDFQELRIPPAKRGKKLVSIALNAELLSHPTCSIYGGGRLHGLSIWPNFKLTGTSGTDSVVRKSQVTGQPHGGYVFGSAVVGSRRLTNETACQVASMAMSYTYAGFPCAVDSLNAHLQRHQGYEPSNVAIVTWVSPTGDAIRYRAYTQDNTRLKSGDRLLVERGYYSNPLATYEVTTPGEAVRAGSPHNPLTSVVRGDVGRVYWSMKRRVADTYPQAPSLVSVELGSSPELPDQVESLLTQGIPVQLNLETHGHFVVADGWVPSYRPGGSARGTYSIKDPYDDRDFTRLIESRIVNGRLSDYANRFRLARYVVPAGGPRPLGLDSAAVAGSGVASLSVLANGTRRVELIDPLGRRMLRDTGSGEDVAEIPGAWIMDVGSEHDDGADWDTSQTGYSIDVAQALEGHYVLRLYASAGHALNVSAYDEAGIFSSDAAGDTSVVSTGSSYDLYYSAAARTVAVTWLGSVGVHTPASPPNRSRLTVRSNPSSGPTEFLISAGVDAGDAIDVFDTSGRRVDVVQVAPGIRTVSWRCSGSGCQPGVYLARLRSGSGAVRFVLVR